MRRWLSAVTALCLLVAACGGSESGQSSGDDQDSSTSDIGGAGDASIESAVAALAEDHGSEGAFAVGVFALEHGYQLQQIIDGALAGTVQRDGTIDNVEPTGEALGLIEINPDSVLFAAVRQVSDPLRIEVLRKDAAETAADLGLVDGNAEVLGTTVMILILGWLDAGWTPEDVIGALIAGLHPQDYNPAGDPESEESVDSDGTDPNGDDGSGTADGSIFLAGSGSLTTTDAGNAETCAVEIDVRATVLSDLSVEMTYTRTVAAGVPPGGVGPGDVSQYVECIEADRSERHTGTFDLDTGIALFEDAGEVRVDVSDDGVASMQGTITATDLLNNWTLDVDLVECAGSCD